MTDGPLLLHDFLAPKRCAVILDELEFAYWTPSTVVATNHNGSLGSAISAARVSQTTEEEWFSVPLRRELRAIERRLQRRLGIDPTHLEAWQATRYRSGGRFAPHLDGGTFGAEPAGERVTTVLVYLTTPQVGGSTRFTELGLDVPATAGTMVMWNNLLPDGTVDRRMRHAARPLRRGRKVVLVTWARERPVRQPRQPQG